MILEDRLLLKLRPAAPELGFEKLSARLIVLRAASRELASDAEEAMNRALDETQGKSLAEAFAAADRALKEFEGRLPAWREERARQRREYEQSITATLASTNLAAACGNARANPLGVREIIAGVKAAGHRLRLGESGCLEIAPPISSGGLPLALHGQLLEHQDAVVQELKRRSTWAPVGSTKL